MDKATQDLNMYQDFVADLGVPFVCPNCNDFFGNEEYLSQHSDICNGMKQPLNSTLISNESPTSNIRSFDLFDSPTSASPTSRPQGEGEEDSDIPSVSPKFVSFCLSATASSDVFHSQTSLRATHHSNDVLLSSTNDSSHSQVRLPSPDESDEYITCPHCMQLFENQFYLNQHVKCPEAQDQHSSLNATTSLKLSALQLHLEEEQLIDQFHTSAGNPSEDGPSSSSLTHQSVSLGGDDRSGIQVCNECKKSFTNKTDLKAHMLIHTGEKPFECLKCGQRFAHKSNLMKHHSVHTQEKPFSCHLCSASFALKSGLKLHWRTHTGERPFKCPECGQRFSSNGNLKKHVTIHSGEKPFGCKVCGRRFSSSEALESHSSSHKREKCFVCSVCDASFTHKNGLQAHIRTHTGEKPFLCDLCELSFARRGGLKVHMRIHTGEKPYSCSECGQAFSHKSNLNAHYRTHTGEKPFSCPFCNQKFGHNSNLKKHIMTHGDEFKLLSPASKSGDSSTSINDTSGSMVSAMTKMTALVGSPFSNYCDSKFIDLEYPSTPTLLGT